MEMIVPMRRKSKRHNGLTVLCVSDSGFTKSGVEGKKDDGSSLKMVFDGKSMFPEHDSRRREAK